MRSRPDVKVYLKPGVVGPGEHLVAETVLESKSETPIDFVEMRLRGVMRAGAGSGNYRQLWEQPIFDSVWRSKPQTLGEGEHRFKVEFAMKDDAPPSYAGADAAIVYELDVHVSIPWWPDRRKTFVVPVKMPPLTPGSNPMSAVFATSTDGPRGNAPFIEVALDATDVGLGDVVSGRISLANLGGLTVRGVDLAFVEMEHVTLPYPAARESGRFKLRVYEGQPIEGEPLPFRVRVPERAMPSFVAGPIKVSTFLEIRADVAWNDDVLVRVPLMIAPSKRASRDQGRVAPVGRERMLAVWTAAAHKLGFVVDAEGDGMHGMHGAVRIRITSEHRDGDYWIVAELAWPDVGLDLDVTERSWRDVLALDAVKTGEARIDDRLTIHARENVQAKPFAEALAPSLIAFDEAKAADAGATLASRGSVHRADIVDGFVARVIAVADTFARARSLVGPPAVLAAHVPAWRAFAEQLGGELRLGNMRIDARMGTDVIEAAAVFGERGVMKGFAVVVHIDPVLDQVPSSPEDPAISPAARDAWRRLKGLAESVQITSSAVSALVEKTVFDPAEQMSVVEAAVALRRALSGVMAAGPFR